MDGTAAIATEPAGFIGWIMQYGQVVAFVAQIVYWVCLVVILFYAVWQFKRWVNFQLGTGRSGQLRDGGAVAKAETVEVAPVAVDEFVD